jgi:hypothetical protein
MQMASNAFPTGFYAGEGAAASTPWYLSPSYFNPAGFGATAEGVGSGLGIAGASGALPAWASGAAATAPTATSALGGSSMANAAASGNWFTNFMNAGSNAAQQAKWSALFGIPGAIGSAMSNSNLANEMKRRTRSAAELSMNDLAQTQAQAGAGMMGSSPTDFSAQRGQLALKRALLGLDSPGGKMQGIYAGDPRIAGKQFNWGSLNFDSAKPFWSNDSLAEGERAYWDAAQNVSGGQIGAPNLGAVGYGAAGDSAAAQLAAARLKAQQAAAAREAAVRKALG